MGRLMQGLAIAALGGVLLLGAASLCDETDPVVKQIGSDRYSIEFQDWSGRPVEPINERRIRIAIQNVEAITGMKTVAREWKTVPIGNSDETKRVGLIITLGTEAQGTDSAAK